jgi:predicted transcriptional regulator of viral defense system
MRQEGVIKLSKVDRARKEILKQPGIFTVADISYMCEVEKGIVRGALRKLIADGRVLKVAEVKGASICLVKREEGE